MDASYSGKRALMSPRKGNNSAFKDAASDQNAKFCNRIGCNGRIKYTQYTKIGTKTDKSKCSNHSSNGNEIIGNSSRSSSKNPCVDSKRKLPSQVELNQSEINAIEIGSSSGSSSSNTKPRKIFQIKLGTNKQPNTQSSSSANNVNGGKYGFKNLKCNSISDVVSKSVGINVTKKKNPEGETSFSQRKTNPVSSVEGKVFPFPSTSGITISDSNNSSRTRSPMTPNNRTRLSYRENGRNFTSVRESDIISRSRFPDPEIPVNIGGSGSSGNGSSSGLSSYSVSSSSGDNNLSNVMPLNSGGFSFSHLRNRDASQRYNIDGIAEVLLALERIEQEEELTHDQVLALETSFFLSGLNLYDRHRYMRLDIDNMSYEELLALEEKMGTVSTALSDETLSKCLTKSIYQEQVRVMGLAEDGDGIKCSICQDEFEVGDEIGNLVECDHGYHSTCINQWLRVKNWCPICKASASPSQASSSA